MKNFMLKEGFYPISVPVFAEMAKHLKRQHYDTVLEPSAGKGDMAFLLGILEEYYRNKHYYFCRKNPELADSNRAFLEATGDDLKLFLESYHQKWLEGHHFYDMLDVDVIEKDRDLRALLKDLDFCNLVGEDFLSFDTQLHYDLIIMNPDFANGDQHLLKAISLQERAGGEICCVLNAETIRNPYTNTRKLLASKLERYNAEVEFISNGFSDAERETDVEVAVVYMDIPFSRKTALLDGLISEAKEEAAHKEHKSSTAVVGTDRFDGIVAHYNLEVALGKKLLDLYGELKPMILENPYIPQKENSYNKDMGISLEVGGKKYVGYNEYNRYVYFVRNKYWRLLTSEPAFAENFTGKMRSIYSSQIDKLEKVEFNKKNIYTMLLNLLRSVNESTEEDLCDWFEKLSYENSMEAEGNIHYFNGWKTNKAFKINKKIIIPGYLCTYEKMWGWRCYEAERFLSDLQKVLAYFDLDADGEISDIYRILDCATKTNNVKNVDTKYFTFTLYKKGTIHIVFRDQKLLDRFNLFGCMRKGWLPPSYGKKHYEEMDADEKTVIDEFQGREEYEEYLSCPENYLPKTEDTTTLLQLAEKANAE